MIRIGRLISMRGKSCIISQNFCQRQAKSELNTTENQTVTDADSAWKNQKDKKDLLKSAYLKLLNSKKINENEKDQVEPKELKSILHLDLASSRLKRSRSKGMVPAENEIDLLQNSHPTQVSEYLRVLSQSNNRPVSVLKVISDILCLNTSNLNLIQSSNTLYYLARLCYKDEELLNKLAENIILKESNFTSGVLPAAILNSIGVLKFRHPELIEVCLKHVIKDNSPKRIQALLKCLITLASVNFMTSYGSVILKELSQCQDTDFNQTKSYLDFVWSCVLLNHLSEEHISKVLSETYVTQLRTYTASVGNNIVSDLKLQNINAAAKNLLTSYKGSYLTKNYCKPQLTKSKLQFLTSVMDGLSYIFPKNGCLLTNKDTGAGFLLDIECCLNSEKAPELLNKTENFTKIAILLLDYNDFCLDKEKTMSGISSFKVRILESEGYKVITVPYTEFPMSLPVTEKINYFKSKLKAV